MKDRRLLTVILAALSAWCVLAHMHSLAQSML
jgi:hypothetical protein